MSGPDDQDEKLKTPPPASSPGGSSPDEVTVGPATISQPGAHGLRFAALQEYVRRRRQLRLLKLFGTIDYDPAYDYKAARRRWRS